jgi:hypothetical protein
MKVILRAQLLTDWGDVTEVNVAEFRRPAAALNADTLGLSLNDGKALLACSPEIHASPERTEVERDFRQVFFYSFTPTPEDCTPS